MVMGETSNQAASGAADPDRACLHPDFALFADVGRIVAEGQPENDETPAIAFRASIRVDCAVCGEKFRWIGVEAGDMPSRPMVGIDEFELRAPIRPASADPDFGLGMPGFAVRFRSEQTPASLTTEEINALPIGSVIVMHHSRLEPVPHPGLTWFRIERGWINAYGSEVPARSDWPYVGQLGGPSAVTCVFKGFAQ
jgi:hypothetical protein